MMTRYQRQEANSVMHVVNSAYNLKNPPSLNQKTHEGVKKVVNWFHQTFVPTKKGLARVSQGWQRCSA